MNVSKAQIVKFRATLKQIITSVMHINVAIFQKNNDVYKQDQIIIHSRGLEGKFSFQLMSAPGTGSKEMIQMNRQLRKLN